MSVDRGKPEVPADCQTVASDPFVWTGRALQAEFEMEGGGLAHLYPALA